MVSIQDTKPVQDGDNELHADPSLFGRGGGGVAAVEAAAKRRRTAFRVFEGVLVVAAQAIAYIFWCLLAAALCPQVTVRHLCLPILSCALPIELSCCPQLIC